MALTVSDAPVRRYNPPPPPPPPPPRKEVDPAVRQPALHQGKPDAPPPEKYVKHKVEQGENLTEISRRYKTDVPMLEAANPQVRHPDAIEVGQEINVPIGADYGREPTRDVVEPGQTLTQMAKEHPGVSAQEIARANRHEIPNANRIQPGQEVWVPNNQPLTPLEQKVQATDSAVANVERAQRDYANLEPGTNRAIRDEMHQGVQSAEAQLKTATQAELDERAKTNLPTGAKPTEADYATAGNQIKDRYQADPAATQKLDTALKSLADDRYRASPQGQADAIVSKARSAGDAPKQMASLGDSLKNAPPEVRDAVLNGAEGKQLVQDAANWATEPLAGGDVRQAQKNIGGGEQAPTAETAFRLSQVTEHLPPEVAAQVTQSAMPTIEEYSKNYTAEFGNQAFGRNGVEDMLKVLDRGADTAAGKSNIDRMAKLGMWNHDIAVQHMANGGSMAYAAALQQQGGAGLDAIKEAMAMRGASVSGSIKGNSEEYLKGMEELNWLITNHGGSMDAQQLEAAIQEYKANKEQTDPGWGKRYEDLLNSMSSDGQKLLQQINDLRKLPPGMHDAAIKAYVESALKDPSAAMAVNIALKEHPELASDVNGQENALLSFFADPTVKGSAKVTDTLRKMGIEFATARMKHTMSQFEGFNPNDPASVTKLNKAIDQLDNPSYAKLLGVKPADMKSATAALRELVPTGNETPEQILAKVDKYDEGLEKIRGKNFGLSFAKDDTGKITGIKSSDEGLKAFDKSTQAGQLLRGAGLALAGVGLAASGYTAANDPTARNVLKAGADTLGLVNKGAEFFVGRGTKGAGIEAVGGKLAGRALGVIGAGFDVWAAGESFGKGDVTKGLIYLAGAAGGVTAALVSGPVGWIALGFVAASAVGIAIVDHHRTVTAHEFDNDNGVATKFLEHSNLTHDVSKALNDQSGEGYSVMPMLNRYAEVKGMDLSKSEDQKKFVDWLNAMPPRDLEALRTNMHIALDKHDGDVSHFEATAPGDSTYQPETGRSGFAPWSVPESAVQFDALLRELNVSPLTP